MNDKIIKLRPTGITPEQKQKFFKEVAQTLINEGWANTKDVEKVVDDLSNIDFFDSGYEIAKDLESRSFGRYNINTQCIEYLDFLDSDKDNIKRQNIKEWVKETNPVFSYKVGDCLTVISSINRELQPSQKVWIHSIHEDTAEYVVSKVEKSNGGFLIPYEKMEANTCLFRSDNKCGDCDSFCECGLTGKKMDDKACEMFDDSYYQFKKKKEEAK